MNKNTTTTKNESKEWSQMTPKERQHGNCVEHLAIVIAGFATMAAITFVFVSVFAH